MADEEHLRRLGGGVTAWNAWRGGRGDRVDLSGADLSKRSLNNIDLRQTDLSDANLVSANLKDSLLSGSRLTGANLSNANLSGARLGGVNLTEARLTGTNLQSATLALADLSDANLSDANLAGADLSGARLFFTIMIYSNLVGANLSNAQLFETVFADVNLTDAVGLETCEHFAASIVDYRTMQQSGGIPLSFLRGVGVPERLIDYLPSVLGHATQYYSCFISYSTDDQEFAHRIYADLQNYGVRCWFAPSEMPIGGKILDEIDTAIRLRDKVLLILSEHSIRSDWVEHEVMSAFEEERKRGQTVLFPVRLDDAVMTTSAAWATKLRDQRNIGDFRLWKNRDGYKRAFSRLTRDLAISASIESERRL